VRGFRVVPAAAWQSAPDTGVLSMHTHKHHKPNCLYCKAVQFVSIGEPPPIKTWKRPLLLVAGVAMTVCTVMAMRFAWERLKLVVEPTGALAAAAALEGTTPIQGRRVGVILSGGNVDLAQVGKWVQYR